MRPTEPKRVAGYVRVSKIGGREGDSFLSPEVQQTAIMRWVDYRQFQLAEWYTDLDLSASRRNVQRPAFEQMLSDAREHRIDVIAVYRLTRFGRTMAETASTYDELERIGVGLVSVTEDIDSTTATGSFVRNMLFAMADFEARRIGEEWSNVHTNRRKRGLMHASRGLYGYRMQGAVPAAIEPVEARAVRQMFQHRAAGASVGELRRWLHREGYRPASGDDYFPVATIRRMLLNPAYAGLVRVDDELIAAQHEPLVSRELWDTVQALHSRIGKLTRHRVGLVSGLAVCAGCGYRMVSWSNAGGRYYRCNARTQARDCSHPTAIAQHRLDEHVEGALFARVPNTKRRRATSSAWERKRDQLARRVTDLDRALDELTSDRFVRGSLPRDEYQRQTERLVALRDRARVELEEAAALAATRSEPIETWRDAWAELRLAEKQTLLRRVIRQVVVEPGTRGGGAPTPVGDRVRIEWITGETSGSPASSSPRFPQRADPSTPMMVALSSRPPQTQASSAPIEMQRRRVV